MVSEHPMTQVDVGHGGSGFSLGGREQLVPLWVFQKGKLGRRTLTVQLAFIRCADSEPPLLPRRSITKCSENGTSASSACQGALSALPQLPCLPSREFRVLNLKSQKQECSLIFLTEEHYSSPMPALKNKIKINIGFNCYKDRTKTVENGKLAIVRNNL